jgi:hypothetical protein
MTIFQSCFLKLDNYVFILFQVLTKKMNSFFNSVIIDELKARVAEVESSDVVTLYVCWR